MYPVVVSPIGDKKIDKVWNKRILFQHTNHFRANTTNVCDAFGLGIMSVLLWMCSVRELQPSASSMKHLMVRRWLAGSCTIKRDLDILAEDICESVVRKCEQTYLRNEIHQI